MRKAMIYMTMAMLAGGSALDAEARAGMGGSMGSRGGRTYSTPSYQAAPIQRSITPRPSPAPQPAYAQPQPAYQPQPAMAPAGGGFLRNAAGGFLGAGLASMLFGHSGYGYGGYGGGMGGVGGMGMPVGGGGGFGGFGILPWLLIGGGIFFYLRRRRQAEPMMAYDAGEMPAGMVTAAPTMAIADASLPLAVTADDQHAFEQVLLGVERCWGEGDLNGLRQYATPEMVQYFKEQLSANASRGLVNKVEQVTLDRAEVLESWKEYELEYATARMGWSACDYMLRFDAKEGDAPVEGSRTTPQSVTEVWTFARASGGRWLLSALQQGS